MKNIKVHFKTRNGETETVEAPEFNTLMEASRYYSKNGYIDNIDADCGGACSCATCHVWVDEKWVDKVGKPDETSAEQELLDYDPLAKPNDDFLVALFVPLIILSIYSLRNSFR